MRGRLHHHGEEYVGGFVSMDPHEEQVDTNAHHNAYFQSTKNKPCFQHDIQLARKYSPHDHRRRSAKKLTQAGTMVHTQYSSAKSGTTLQNNFSLHEVP